MAPLATRQSHSLSPGIPRLPARPPNTPVKVHKEIDPVVFFELFAGTVGIFIIAVVFWKVGGFIRRFNRSKVLRAGKNTNTRYARTWYGWVKRPTHERNKRVIHDFFSRIWKLMTWKSTRDDYTWIWWDPGDVEKQKHRREPKRFRWLPDWLKSYDDSPTADEIWNPSRPKCHGALKESVSMPQTVPAPASVRPQAQEDIPGQTLPRKSTLVNNQPIITRSILEELLRDPLQPNDGSSDDQPWFNSRKNAAKPATRAPMPFQQVQSLPYRQNKSYQIRGSIPWSRGEGSQAISCQIQSVMQHEDFQYELAEPKGSMHTELPKPLHRHSNHGRYRGWSARLQMGPKEGVFDNIRDSSGPPGTPRSELLVSYVSDSSSSIRGHLKRQRNRTEGRLHISEDRTSFTSRLLIGNQVLFANERRTYTKTIQWNSAPARSNFRGKGTNSKARPALSDEWRFMCDSKHPGQSRRQGKRPDIDLTRCSADQIQLKTGSAVDELSDWEVRMMERLDRKLLWLFNEFTPGQKPYHFALLANHWLNRETWLVYDPVSRVSTDARRVRGDPRFNVPYPRPVFSPRPKYPISRRKRAQTPRIDSWRAAVNKQRKVSGIRDAIRTITLYDESIEEPPDGHVDTGCWLLPKPPQGFEISTAQKNAWYEGGAGWQEKLDDWQQVHRGYRVHKALHEGRVNRGRIKEVAAQVNKCCRTASGKLIPNYDFEKTRAPNFLVS